MLQRKKQVSKEQGNSVGPNEDTIRYILFIGAVILVLVSIGLGIVYFTTPYRQVLKLNAFVYNDEGFYRMGLPLTPARYWWLRGVLTASAFLGIILIIGVGRASQQVLLLREELRQSRARLNSWWGRLPVSAKIITAGLVTVLLIVRGWYLLNYPLGTDEIASYDYFVREGIVAITSYYPIPNNHIFYNLLAWPLAQAGLSPRLVMRLPTLLLGTFGTIAGYVLLARLTGLRLATLIMGLVGLVPLWVYYAAVGRGYFIQFCLLQFGFFAVIELLRPASAYWRLSWLAFIGSSILGLYTIPTFAYPLASLLAGSGVGFLVQRRGQNFWGLAVTSVVILAVTMLLYTPIITVSGWHQLVANRYVAAKTAAQFWPSFRAILYETAAELFGPSLRLSGPAWLAGALLGAVVVRRGLPAGSKRTIGYLCWAMLAMPLLLMVVQRVYAPLRTVLYLTFFGYLLAALLLLHLPIRLRLAGSIRWLLILLLITGVGTLRLYRHQTQVQASQAETQQLQQAYQWLQTHTRLADQPAQVWLYAPLHELFFAHYLHQAAKQNLVLHSGGSAGPDQPYDIVVLDNFFSATAAIVRSEYHSVYHDRLVTIYVINR